MARLLKEKETKKFGSEVEMKNFLDLRASTDKWVEIYTHEIALEGLPYSAPLLMTSELDKLRERRIFFSEEASSMDSMLECMERNSVYGILPYNDRMTIIPMRDIAYSSLLERVQLGGDTMRRCTEKNGAKALSPTDKTDFLNKALKLYDKKCKVLVQDEEISTVRSAKYIPTPGKDIVDITEKKIKETWAEMSFAGASANHEYFDVTYSLNDFEKEELLLKELIKAGYDADSVEITARLVTSDVGESAIRITPVIVINDKELATGNAISVSHLSDVTVWEQRLDKLLNLIKSGEDMLIRLASQKIENIEATLTDFFSQYSLSKRIMEEICDDMYSLFAGNCTALDIYYYLVDYPSRAAEVFGRELTSENNFKWADRLATMVNEFVW